MDLSVHEGKIPITYVHVAGGGGHSQRQSQIHPSYSIIHHDSPAAPTPLSVATPLNSKKGAVLVKYRECLKNHAASIGGNATDGCGEFMPSGEEGTLEALMCSACNCHRNFHRKEIEGGKEKIPQNGVLNPFLYNPRPSTQQMIRPLGAIQTSESDEMETYGGAMTSPSLVKKRPRTKFTPKQKEMMLDFAEKLGWRLQRQEDGVVQHFCQEIGVKRRVFKVWMHNNKHNLQANKSSNLQLDRSTTTLNDL